MVTFIQAYERFNQTLVALQRIVSTPRGFQFSFDDRSNILVLSPETIGRKSSIVIRAYSADQCVEFEITVESHGERRKLTP